MAITNNNKVQLDLPWWEVLCTPPITATVGICGCNDRRGTDRYIYVLFSATSFWRYDTWGNTWQQLASPPAGTVGAGTCMCFDPSRGYVWAFIANGTAANTFQYYDTATNTWTARSVTGVTATFGTDGSLCHTCTTYHGSGDDDAIYLIGNAGTAWFKYSVTGNSWSTMGTALTATAGAGSEVLWLPTWDPDKLLIVRGTATATIYQYVISTPAISTLTYIPASETFTTGSQAVERNLTTFLLQQSALNRITEFKPTTLTLEPVASSLLVPNSTAHVGRRLWWVKTADNIEYLYYMPQTQNFLVRAGLLF